MFFLFVNKVDIMCAGEESQVFVYFRMIDQII